MKKTYKIYQTDFSLESKNGTPEHEHDFFLKLDDVGYSSIEDAEDALHSHLDVMGDEGEFTILPIYTQS